MQREGPPAHYVKHNKVTRLPRSYIYLDTEAVRTGGHRHELQTFRLAVALAQHRRHDSASWADGRMGVFDTPFELWAWVTAQAQARARTVCVAHNVAYDLRIADAFGILPALGWRLTDIRMARQSAYCKWRNGDRTLVCVDLFAWLPTSLEQIGELVEIPKLALPEWEDSREAWVQRCTRDVEIVGAAVRRLVDWVRDDDLGNWRATGAGQAWSAFRHRFMHHKLLAHDNEGARAAERVAAWTGRCEVWQHGRPRGGPFSEWDFTTAYAHVMADSEVPYRLVGESSHCTPAQLRTLSRKYCVLAEVEVTTDVPTLPARIDGQVCWPVGRFTTTVWDHELAVAIEHGADVSVSRLWWYRRAPVLASFGRWLLDLLDQSRGQRDPVVLLAAKHWSRALVGRFGARWSQWTDIGIAPEVGCELRTVIDRTAGETWTMLHVGNTLKRESVTRDGRDAVVAIMSWIMAECRVRLWQLVQTAGPDHVVYMDTDGLIVDREGSARLQAAAVPGLRLKGQWGTVEVLGVRSLLLSGELRAAGVPKRAIRVGPETWDAEFWEQLPGALRHGRPNSVRIDTRAVHVSGRDARRRHLADGRTEPLRAS